jgi:hypothetical protein
VQDSSSYGSQEILLDCTDAPNKVFSAEEMLNFVETSNDSLDDAPKVELKPLPATLCYEYLESNETYPVIINATLNDEQTQKLLRELRKHWKAIGYTIRDLKGINPSICMHRISTEDDHKLTIETQ